jgi:hypothetical protein
MESFWSAFWHAFRSDFNIVLAIIGFISLAIGSVLDFIVFRKSEWETHMKVLRALPFIIFGLLMIFVFIFGVPYTLWRTDQNQMNNTLSNQQSQINELKQELSSVDALTIISLPTSDQIINSPNSAKVTLTATPYFNPSQTDIMHRTVVNNFTNPLFEILVFQLSPQDFKFNTIDTTNLPSNISILDGYYGTNTVIITITDFAPLESATIDLPVFTMDNAADSKNLNINEVILDHHTLP